MKFEFYELNFKLENKSNLASLMVLGGSLNSTVYSVLLCLCVSQCLSVSHCLSVCVSVCRSVWLSLCVSLPVLPLLL